MTSRSVAVGIAITLLAGCYQTNSVSVLTGELRQDSFPYATPQATAVTAGRPDVVTPVASDGRFTLELKASRTYRVYLSDESGPGADRALLLYPRGSVIDRALRTPTHGWAHDLGRIDYHASMPELDKTLSARFSDPPFGEDEDDDGAAATPENPPPRGGCQEEDDDHDHEWHGEEHGDHGGGDDDDCEDEDDDEEEDDD